MGNFFAKDWPGPPFELFGTAHLVGLAMVALAAFLVSYFGRRASEENRRWFRYGLTAVLLVTEISWHLWNYFTGQWTIQTMLPLHLCSALIWLSAFMLITRNYAVYEFAYLLGVAGALQALLTPDAGPYGFPHFRFFQVVISHGTLVTSAVYMTVAEGFRPTKDSVRRVILFSNVYMGVVFVINQLIGSNYLFIAHKPETASILDMLPPWPWYIGIIELLGVGFALLFYAPFALKDVWQHRRQMQKA